MTPPHGLAHGDNINDPPFKSSLKNDEFFGFGRGMDQDGPNHPRVCNFYSLLFSSPVCVL